MKSIIEINKFLNLKFKLFFKDFYKPVKKIFFLKENRKFQFDITIQKEKTFDWFAVSIIIKEWFRNDKKEYNKKNLIEPTKEYTKNYYRITYNNFYNDNITNMYNFINYYISNNKKLFNQYFSYLKVINKLNKINVYKKNYSLSIKNNNIILFVKLPDFLFYVKKNKIINLKLKSVNNTSYTVENLKLMIKNLKEKKIYLKNLLK